MRLLVCLFLSLLFISAAAVRTFAAEAEPTVVLQDFEGAYKPTQWADKDNPGKVTVSSEWKGTGQKSLKIDPGLATTIEDLKLKDWSQYNTLRLTLHVAGDEPAQMNFEIRDAEGMKNYWNRHINFYTLHPGDQVLDVDYSGGLYRGEPTSHWRGPVKTPVDITKISLISLGNGGKNALYIGKIELVKKHKIQTPGGFAFEFCGASAMGMSQYINIKPDTKYAPQQHYGFLGAGAGPGATIHNEMTWPTPLLGSGVALPPGGFQVDLDGGKYIGWIAFERGGYWGPSESCGYDRADLKINGATVHSHDFDRAGIHFMFQDLEITDMKDVVDKMIWPTNAVSRFEFQAVKGNNVFTVDTRNPIHMKLRVAGLVVAPATEAGKAFVDELDALQRKVANETFAPLEKSRRGEGRAAPTKPLVYEVLPPGELVYPKDWPTANAGTPPAPAYAVTGQTYCVHLALFANQDANLTVSAAAPKGAAVSLDKPKISYGCYLPNRAQVGSAWIELDHYRPEASFSVGPNVTRSVLVEFPIGPDAKGGTYTTTISVAGAQAPLSIPVTFTVVPVKLQSIPIPVGLFSNSMPIDPSELDEETWWRLQESILREQVSAGFTALTGGAGLGYTYENGKIVDQGGCAVKYVRMAEKFGPILAIVNYGGFGYAGATKDPAGFAKALKEFEQANHMPPHYVNMYDEPATDEALKDALARIKPLYTAGLRVTGYTSQHDNNPLWDALIQNSYAPSANAHQTDYFAKVRALGNHPWVYNNGVSRYATGLYFWKQIKLGAEGRLDWIGFNTNGFAFNNLDGREPALASFAVHRKLGVLPNPKWFSRREGLLDCRIALTLEKLAANDPVLKSWNSEGYSRKSDHWTNAELDKWRNAALTRLAELAGKAGL